MEIVLVLVITAGAVWLFVTERFRVDLVALMLMAALILTGLVLQFLGWGAPGRWITPSEGVSGFSNPAVLTVAAMFVLSAGLQKTGAVEFVARWLEGLARHPVWLVLVTVLLAGAVSAFINNTAVVAVFLPMVLAACARGGVSPSRVLIPLSYAAQMGGVCTLVGTSTNLLVNALSERAGVGSFQLFEFAPLGVVLLGVGSVYLVVAGWWWLPHRRGVQRVESYQLGPYLAELRVREDSRLAGRVLGQTPLSRGDMVAVLEVLRQGRRLFMPLQETIRAGDILLVRADPRALMELKADWGLELLPGFAATDASLEGEELKLAEVMIPAGSAWRGRTLSSLNFQHRFGATVLAVRAGERTLQQRLSEVELDVGDALLVLGPGEALERLRQDPNVLVLQPVDEPVLRRHKIPVAVGVVAGVMLLTALNVLPVMVSAIIGCIALVAFRCLTLDEAYGAVDWRVVFLLAGTWPLGLALEKSGAAAGVAEAALFLTGDANPWLALAVLYGVTALLTEFLSNNATAVMLTPVALSLADSLGVDPKPFLMAVCFAASTSFTTPLGYQTNAMVYHPGGYRYMDFVRMGLPLNLIFWAISVAMIPRLWPF
ncbi:SLC13 family permease [Limisphaera ngatamarikiensis]|uniref:SLC13 family permease n=1 Tax=Limisphaera ngatamarikiensis TaxID=1324935 RepID=A0A6M1RET1_9BACT|nr:SLC13 family permease [Limisphaera ngatamarikiensis]NGO38106.1 SLC13 family permease [Limisphaera ngatamarikiensis]